MCLKDMKSAGDDVFSQEKITAQQLLLRGPLSGNVVLLPPLLNTKARK